MFALAVAPSALVETNMPKLFLHPGSPKAGSTYLQIFCRQNAELLAERGVQFIPEFRHIDYRDLYSGEEARYADNFECDVLSKVDSDMRIVLLSFENIGGDPFWPDGLFARGPKIAEGLLPLLSGFSEIQTLWIHRDLGSFLLSAYNQRKKQGRKITFPEFTEMVRARDYGYNHIIELLEIFAGKGPVSVMLFEELQLRPKRFLRQFFKLMDVTVDDKFDMNPPNKNPSISEEGAKILEFSKDLLKPDDFTALRKLLQKRLPKTGYTVDEEAFLAEFKDRFDAENATFLSAAKGLGTLYSII